MTEDQLKDHAQDLYEAVLRTVQDFSDKVDWIVLDMDKFQVDIEELREQTKKSQLQQDSQRVLFFLHFFELVVD